MYIFFEKSSTWQSPDIRVLTKEDVLELIKEDNSVLELYFTEDDSILLRVYFDIEKSIKSLDEAPVILQNIMDLLCSEFGVGPDTWAICDGTREGRASFHIISKKYCIDLKTLRALFSKLTKVNSTIDSTALSFKYPTPYNYNMLRLPNQSKYRRLFHQDGPPLKLIQGGLEDCLITCVDGLELYLC
jgi:hypothetical protein